mgnify:CR=1 FL=1
MVHFPYGPFHFCLQVPSYSMLYNYIIVQYTQQKPQIKDKKPADHLFDTIEYVECSIREGGITMESARGHFVNISDLRVDCIIHETTEKPYCLIDIIGFGVFRARPMQGTETCRQYKYSDYLVTNDKRYILINRVPPD